MPQRASLAGNILGGGLCEYLVIPAWQVIRIPDDADLRHAALTEPLACCIHSIRKARIKFADYDVIIGMGSWDISSEACSNERSTDHCQRNR